MHEINCNICASIGCDLYVYNYFLWTFMFNFIFMLALMSKFVAINYQINDVLSHVTIFY